MTPTPEDIALVKRLNHTLIMDENGDVALHQQDATQLIAAHTAPLRELAEIGRLAVAERKQFIPGGTHAVAMACDAYLAKHPTEKP